MATFDDVGGVVLGEGGALGERILGVGTRPDATTVKLAQKVELTLDLIGRYNQPVIDAATNGAGHIQAGCHSAPRTGDPCLPYDESSTGLRSATHEIGMLRPSSLGQMNI